LSLRTRVREVSWTEWIENDSDVSWWTVLPLPVTGVHVDRQRYPRGIGASLGREIGGRFLPAQSAQPPEGSTS
jgi:hypothetical protein